MTQPVKLAPDVIRSLAAAHAVAIDQAAALRIADAFGANLAISQTEARQLPLDLEPMAWRVIAKRCGASR